MAEIGCRPVVVLARDAVIPRHRRALVAPCTTTIRGLVSEVGLESGEGPVPRRCVVNMDSVESVSVAVLVDRLGRLADGRMRQISEPSPSRSTVRTDARLGRGTSREHRWTCPRRRSPSGRTVQVGRPGRGGRPRLAPPASVGSNGAGPWPRQRRCGAARGWWGNVRVSLRRPRGPDVRTQTVSVALPMSSPATRSWTTSMSTLPCIATDGVSSGGPSARTQTHALTAAIKGHPRAPRHTDLRAPAPLCRDVAGPLQHSHRQGQRSKSQPLQTRECPSRCKRVSAPGASPGECPGQTVDRGSGRPVVRSNRWRRTQADLPSARERGRRFAGSHTKVEAPPP
ncbi:type II toxin-antitoxin system PemK/MazF family toxin [Geodermatophilus sp. TF02-6]|uniref:type II toxin-antitoxin system PemK/MazF family toxin n=1 Tax=Geodermatophilus sp. TF02-6 TaxID=2250575 RepID=UPI001F38C8EF|nr:type II toxin-antitoxin system PemK/MazF family toxin [Geodermatophilus sp. TF02-6]